MNQNWHYIFPKKSLLRAQHFKALIVNNRNKEIIFDIFKFILGSEAQGNKTKEMYYSFILSLKMISFVLFPQASQPSMNFIISESVYYRTD